MAFHIKSIVKALAYRSYDALYFYYTKGEKRRSIVIFPGNTLKTLKLCTLCPQIEIKKMAEEWGGDRIKSITPSPANSIVARIRNKKLAIVMRDYGEARQKEMNV